MMKMTGFEVVFLFYTEIVKTSYILVSGHIVDMYSYVVDAPQPQQRRARTANTCRYYQ